MLLIYYVECIEIFCGEVHGNPVCIKLILDAILLFHVVFFIIY